MTTRQPPSSLAGTRALFHAVLRIFGITLWSLLLTVGLTSRAKAQIQERSRLIAALDSAAAAHAADSAVAGVSVGVLHKGDTLLLNGYGRADLELNVPMAPDAVYEVGSVTKQFTAAAILQLAAKDSLDLDAPITEYLPDHNTRGRAITVRHLLSHTSGIRDYLPMAHARALAGTGVPRDSMLSVLGAEPLRFASGTAMVYSNSGYFLLGLIIETASGRSYEDYLQTHVLAPAGMKVSRYCDRDVVIEGRAHGYRWTEEGFAHNDFGWNHRWVYAAGALCSTVPDLLAWTQALRGGEILPDSLYREMIRPGRLADGTELRYGMGLVVSASDGHPVHRHGGFVPGYRSEWRYYPDDSLTIVVLQNTTGPQGPGSLANALARRVLGPGEAPTSGRYAGDPTDFEGRYSGPGRGGLTTLQIEVKGKRLLAREIGSDEDPDTLTYQSGLTWRTVNKDRKTAVHYRFIRAGGQVVELRVDVNGGHYVLRPVGEP